MYIKRDKVRIKSIVLDLHDVIVGGAVASWLVRSTQDRVVRVRALAGYIVLWSWARHNTPSGFMLQKPR